MATHLLATIPRQWADDYSYCRNVAKNHTENFPVASLLLPARMRPHLFAIYAFARIADDIADTPGHPDNEKLRRLDDWQRMLDQAANSSAKHPIFRALSHTCSTTDLAIDHLYNLLTAFRLDITKKEYESSAELEEYCHYSANPVGAMFLQLAGEGNDENILYSNEICTALQLTNHWQDLGIDPGMGRPLYLPREVMQNFGVTEETIRSRRFTPAFGEMMFHLIAIERDRFNSGKPLINRLSGRLRLEISMIWESGMSLLNRMEELGGNTLRHRPRLTKADKITALFSVIRRELT